MSKNKVDYVGIFRAYLSPGLAIFGLIGSMFTVVVFSKEKPRSRFSIYATFMAINSGLTLIVNTFIDDFLGRGLYYATNHQFYYKLDSVSDFWCKLTEYLSNTTYFNFSYLIVAFSCDRLLTIHKPFIFYSIYHQRWAVLTCSLVVIIGIISNSPLFIIQTLVQDPRSRTNFTCRMVDDHPLAKFSIVFEAIGTFTIPVFVVSALNILICIKLWKLKKARNSLMPSDQTKNHLEMARVMGHLAVSTVFLFLEIPIVVLVLIRLNLTLEHMDRHSEYALHIIDLSRLFSSIKDIIYAINFPIYFIFLKNVRTRFYQMFGKYQTSIKHKSSKN